MNPRNARSQNSVAGVGEATNRREVVGLIGSGFESLIRDEQENAMDLYAQDTEAHQSGGAVNHMNNVWELSQVEKQAFSTNLSVTFLYNISARTKVP